MVWGSTGIPEVEEEESDLYKRRVVYGFMVFWVVDYFYFSFMYAWRVLRSRGLWVWGGFWVVEGLFSYMFDGFWGLRFLGSVSAVMELFYSSFADLGREFSEGLSYKFEDECCLRCMLGVDSPVQRNHSLSQWVFPKSFGIRWSVSSRCLTLYSILSKVCGIVFNSFILLQGGVLQILHCILYFSYRDTRMNVFNWFYSLRFV